MKVDRRSTLGCHCRPRATPSGIHGGATVARGQRERYRGKKGALCEIRALLMVIGPPYDCRVTFDDRTDLIVFYCIRRPTTPTGTLEARVFQTIPIFFPFSSFFFPSSFLLSFQTESASFKTTLEMEFPGIGIRGSSFLPR